MLIRRYYGHFAAITELVLIIVFSIIVSDFFWPLSTGMPTAIIFTAGIIHFFISFFLLSYEDYFKKSRVSEVMKLLVSNSIGSILLFWVYKGVYDIEMAGDVYFFIMIFILFPLLLRIVLLNFSKYLLRSKKIQFNTIIIGTGKRSEGVHRELKKINSSLGLNFLGVIGFSEQEYDKNERLPLLGTVNELEGFIASHEIHEIILSPEAEEEDDVLSILEILEGCSATISIIPDIHRVFSGGVTINHIVGVPIIQVSRRINSLSYSLGKRIFDIAFSSFFIALGLPLFIVCSLMVLFSSPGGIFFVQERMGYHGRKFKLIKFRSMYKGSESAGPQLAVDNDVRMTKWGRIMRKTRLDEIPQFFNVLIGQMSVVGPRPEREFFVNQIINRTSLYRRVFRVKPGITSLGQVKYGYAHNVDEMIQRLKYDLLYIENMSFTLDIRILVYTVLTVLKGKGK